MEDFSVASRLRSLIDSLGLTDSQFADSCSISRPTLSLLLSGKNKKISDVMLSQIHEAFPNVSILWLLFGEGDKFLKTKNDDNNEINHSENSLFQDNDTEPDEQLNLINVRQLEEIVQQVVNKSFESSILTIENIIRKKHEPISQRKVSKIMVYYDDSTFEAFVPEKIIS